MWIPKYDDVNRVVLKNVRGHVFYEHGRPVLTEPSHVWARPVRTMTREERVAFESVSAGIVGWRKWEAG